MSPAELAYVERLTDVPVAGASGPAADTVLTFPAVTLDGQTVVEIEFYTFQVTTPPVATAAVVITLWDGSTDLGTIAQPASPTANSMYVPVRVTKRFTPAAGTHTFSIRAWRTGGSNGNIGAAGGMPIWARITTRSSPIPNFPVSTLPVGYGTTLPSAPVNGQEHILVDSLTAPSYQWRFRYNAGASGPYKWEFIGGAPATHNINTAETCATSGSYQNLATNGPLITLPRAGDYRAEALVSGNAGSTVPNTLIAGIGVGDFTSPINASTFYHAVATQTGMFPLLAELLARAAGDVIKLRYRTSAGTSAWFGERTLRITPVRVA